MKFILVITIFHSLAISECGSHKLSQIENKGSNDSLPVCITKKIDMIKQEPVWNPPAQVDEYMYKNKQVFLFSSNCCDQYNMLYDNQCNLICAPSGGFAGRGDGKCPDFFETAKHIKLIWKDPR